MRKGIFFSLLCLIAVFAVACGGGNNAGDSDNGDGGENGCTENGGEGNGDNGDGNGGDADAYALYRTVGNMWKMKSTTKMEGMDPMVSVSATEVIDVNDEGATIKITSYDADGNETSSNEAPVPFATADGETGEAGDAPETTDETITVEAGEFECTKTVTEANGATTTTWMSKEHPGLTVKSETTGGQADTTMELVDYEIK